MFRTGDGRILVVEPTYKSAWEIPGGQVEQGESPRKACEREVREELGLTITVGPLLCVDFVPESDCYRFVFDGGTLDGDTIARISLPADELRSYRFVSLDEAVGLVGDRLGRRLRAVVGVGARSGPYLEDGGRPGPQPRR